MTNIQLQYVWSIFDDIIGYFLAIWDLFYIQYTGKFSINLLQSGSPLTHSIL